MRGCRKESVLRYTGKYVVEDHRGLFGIFCCLSLNLLVLTLWSKLDSLCRWRNLNQEWFGVRRYSECFGVAPRVFINGGSHRIKKR